MDYRNDTISRINDRFQKMSKSHKEVATVI